MKGTTGLVQFIRFNIMGIVHILTFSLMLFIGRKIGLGHFWSGAMGYLAVLFVGAIGNIFYVFRSLSKNGNFWSYFIKNALVYISSVALELFVTHEVVPFLENRGVSDTLIVITQYCVYGVGGLYVFFMNRYVVFRNKKP